MRCAVYYAQMGGPAAEIADLRVVARAVISDGAPLALVHDPSDLPPGICARLYGAWSVDLRAEAKRLQAMGVPVRFLSEEGGGTGRLPDVSVLVTRAKEQAETLAALLRLQGARPLILPAIRFAPPKVGGPLRAAVGAMGDFDYIAFTSATGVRSFLAALGEGKQSPGALGVARLFAVGASTADALSREGLSAEGMPSRQSASGLALYIKERTSAAQLGLVIGPEPPDAELVRALQDAGLTVQAVSAYRTISGVDPQAAAALRQGPLPQAALFYSPSAVRGTLQELPAALLRGSLIVAVGPTTAAALRAEGLPPDALAEEPSDAAVVDALCELWQQHPKREEG